MVHKYVEIQEEDYDMVTEIPNMVRLAVTTDAEAEAIYAEHKDKFTKAKGKVVEGDHKADGKSKPCKERKIKADGKIEKEVIEPVEEV